MISKHVDLIAVGFLLVAVAVFSSAKQAVVMTFGGPVHYFRMEKGRDVRVPAMPHAPALPQMPRLPLHRD